MSKDKKNQDTQGKELSEWQKRNQEYLQKKAEEEAKRAEEEAREKKNKYQSLLKALKKCQNGKNNITSIWVKNGRKIYESEEEDEESEKSEEKDSDTSDETQMKRKIRRKFHKKTLRVRIK